MPVPFDLKAGRWLALEDELRDELRDLDRRLSRIERLAEGTAG